MNSNITIPKRLLPILKLQRGSDNIDEVMSFSKAHVDALYDDGKCQGHIMDIGCGLGIMMAMVGNSFDKITLVDKTNLAPSGRVGNFGPSEDFNFYNDMDYCEMMVKENTNDNVEVFTADPSNLPECSFDVITSFYSWGYHYGFDNDYIEYVKKSLKEGGALYLTLRLDRTPTFVEILESHGFNVTTLKVFANSTFVRCVRDNK